MGGRSCAFLATLFNQSGFQVFLASLSVVLHQAGVPSGGGPSLRAALVAHEQARLVEGRDRLA